MGKELFLEKIGAFQHALDRRGINIEKLVLFGSQANGTSREGSDIDLMVVSPDFEDKDLHQRLPCLPQPLRKFGSRLNLSGKRRRNG